MIDNLIWLNINSNNRISGDSWNFIYKIDIPQLYLNKINYVSITNINIPKWYYTFDNSYNHFSYSENNEIINIYIPIGNYSKNQFYKQISTLMTTNSLNNIWYIMSDETTLYDTGLSKIIANNNINNYDIKLIFYKNDVNYAFGYNENWENIFINNIIISPNIINLNFANNILLHSNCVNWNINDIYWNDILCNIYCSSFQNFWYIWQYFDIIWNMKKFNQVNGGIYKFVLTNEDNEIINLNNVELWFTINFFWYTSLEKIYQLLNWYWKLKIAEKFAGI